MTRTPKHPIGPELVKNRPRLVSIGMPVYNGELFIREALESLLAQTLSDFELIISDNGSSDATEQICREMAAKDPRITYHRQDCNRGAAWNFNHVLSLGSGKYFAWAAHDDLWDPAYLERCTEALETDPGAILCYTATQVTTPDGGCEKVIGVNPGLSSANIPTRLVNAWSLPPQVLVFGVIRREVLAATAGIGNYSSSDRVLSAELALQGRFIGLDQTLFYYRRHPLQSTGVLFPNRKTRLAWFDPAKAGKRSFPNWRLLKEFGYTILRAPMNLRDRCWCFLLLLSWILRHRKKLASDFSIPLSAKSTAPLQRFR